jgi:hypothetical protein
METKVRVGGLVSNPFPYSVQGPVSKGMVGNLKYLSKINLATP